MRWDGTNNVMPIGWSNYSLWIYNGNIGFNTWNGNVYGISASGLQSRWVHVVAEFANGDATNNKLWIDGVSQTLSDLAQPTTTQRSVGSELRLGGVDNGAGYEFYGDLDEVRIYNGTLTDAEVQQIMDDTTPCNYNALPSYFALNHDNQATYCLAEGMSATAYSSDNSVLNTYTGSITLDTQTGTGTWSLVSGNGSFNDAAANDGRPPIPLIRVIMAVPALHLPIPKGQPPLMWMRSIIVITPFAITTTKATLVFAATGFTVTANALSNPPSTPINDPIAHQTAGQSFPVHIAAYGINPENDQCGVIETYHGNKTINLATQYHNPTTGTLSASGSGTVSFINGQGSLSARYDDVGQINLAVEESGTSINGQTNQFVVKPADFSISVTANPATTDSGSGFIASGEAFTAQVQALNAQGAVTPNYGNEQTPESVNISIQSLVFPTGGNVGNLSVGAITQAANNTFEASDLSWNEVGSIRLQASVADGDYLGAGDVNR